MVATYSARRLALALFCIGQLVLPPSVIAQTASTATTAPPPASQTQTPILLDLGSTTPVQTLELSSPVSIQVGGKQMLVNSTTALTAAQLTAVNQVLATGRQTLNIGTAGNAIAGMLNLGSQSKQALLGMNVPSGVTALVDFSNGSLVLPENLINAGNFFAFSTNLNSTNAIIQAANIANLAGGVLTTVLPAGGLPGVSNAISNLSLTLNADSVTNAGIISSAAHLNITASSIQNSGILSAVQNVNLSGHSGGNLNINNQGGLIEASQGAVNISLLNSDANSKLSLVGGMVRGNTAVNLDAGLGKLDVNVSDLLGPVAINAGCADLAVTSGLTPLEITSFVVTGDPNVLLNVASYSGPISPTMGGYVDITTTTGAINVTSAIVTTPTANNTNAGYVKLNSATNITLLNIDTTGLGDGNGGDVTLLAKGNISATGGIVTSSGATGSRAGDITIRAGSGGTGNVSIAGAITGDVLGTQPTGRPSNLIITAPGAITTSTTSFKGNITMDAGTTLSSGAIDTLAGAFNDVSLRAGAGSLTVSGDISAVAGGTGAQGGDIRIIGTSGTVNLQNVNTFGFGAATAGSVSIAGNSVSFDSIDTSIYGLEGLGDAGNVTITALGQGAGNPGNITGSFINATSVYGDGGNVLLSAGNGSAAAGSAVGSLTIDAINTGAGGAGFKSGDVNLIATGTVTALSIDTSTPTGYQGGNVTIQGGVGGTGTTRAPTQGGTLQIGDIDTSAPGKGGNVVIANLANNQAISGGNIKTDATGRDGHAGSISAIAHGTITFGDVSAKAAGDGASTSAWAGDVLMSSGATTGTSITLNSLNLSATPGHSNLGGNAYFPIWSGASAALGATDVSGGVTGSITVMEPLSVPATNYAGTSGGLYPTFEPGNIDDYRPGGFASISAPANNNGNIAVYVPGDSRLIVPIVARGGNSTFNAVWTEEDIPPTSIYIMGAGSLSFSETIYISAAEGVSSDYQFAAANLGLYSSAGSISTQTIEAIGRDGGNVTVLGSQGITLPNGENYQAYARDEYAGFGGTVNMFAPAGGINLGTNPNTTDNYISVSGGYGGTVRMIALNNIVDHEVTVWTDSLNGGGHVALESINGGIQLYTRYNSSNHYNASIISDADGPFGGTIDLKAANDIRTLREGTGTGSTNMALVAGAYDRGGSVSIKSSFGSIDLSQLDNVDVSSYGWRNSAGIITITAPNGNVTSNNLYAEGSNGGSIYINADSFNLNNGYSISVEGSNAGSGVVSIQTNSYIAPAAMTRTTKSTLVAAGMVALSICELKVRLQATAQH